MASRRGWLVIVVAGAALPAGAGDLEVGKLPHGVRPYECQVADRFLAAYGNDRDKAMAAARRMNIPETLIRSVRTKCLR